MPLQDIFSEHHHGNTVGQLIALSKFCKRGTHFCRPASAEHPHALRLEKQWGCWSLLSALYLSLPIVHRNLHCLQVVLCPG